MVHEKIVNTVRIITKSNVATKQVLKYISSSEKILDFNNIIKTDTDNEKSKIEKWGQPTNPNILTYIVEDKEILIKFKTLFKPPVKIMKQLSLFSAIEELILSFANIDMKSESGLYHIRRGGVIQTIFFEENSEETQNFSAKLIQQLENYKFLNSKIKKEMN